MTAASGRAVANSTAATVDWAPLLKETPQYKAFVVWDKDRQIYAEPLLPVWDEIESRMADRLVTAYADTHEDGPAPATIGQAIVRFFPCPEQRR